MKNADNKSNNETKNRKNGEITTDFREKKYIHGAVTWFLCALLLIPAYIVTKIWAMVAIVPLVLVLGAGFLIEGIRSQVKFEEDGLLIRDCSAFLTKIHKLKSGSIKIMNVEISTENSEETVEGVDLITDNARIQLPNVDDKAQMVSSISKKFPGIRIEKINGLTKEQQKDMQKLTSFTIAAAVFGVIIFFFLPREIPGSVFSSVVAGGAIGGGIGFIMWFIAYNISGKGKLTRK